MSGIVEVIDGVDRSKIFGRVLWNDINMPVSALKLGSSGPSTINILASGGVEGLGFSGGALVQSVNGNAEILHGYLEGSDIHFHAHWMPTTANSGDVKWQLEYSWAKINDNFAAPTIISSIDAASGTPWDHQLAPFAAIDGAGMTINSAVQFRLFRDPTDGEDTYGFNAALVQIGIHYQIDVYGSRTESIK